MNPVSLFISGAVAMGFFVSSLFFFRFWRETKDRLFCVFGFAFLSMGLEHIVILFFRNGKLDEGRPLDYIFRLLAFAMILIGIVLKNRGAEKRINK
jgi:hypothetical protein